MNLSYNKNPESIVKSSDEYFDYANFFEYKPKNIHDKSLPSSFILAKAFETMEIDKRYIDLALKIQEKQGVNRTVFGLRLYGNVIDLEYYFFYPKKFKKNSFENVSHLLNPYCKSNFKLQEIGVDAHLLSVNLKPDGIEGMNIYYPVIDKEKPLMTVADTGYYFNSVDPVIQSCYLACDSSQLEKVNTYYSFFGVHQLYEILERVYWCCRQLFPNEDSYIANQILKFPYLYKNGNFFYPSAVTLKKDTVGFYFLNISFDNLILFLRFHKYPESFVVAIEEQRQNLNHIQFDVGFDIFIKDGQLHIRKAAFGGIF